MARRLPPHNMPDQQTQYAIGILQAVQRGDARVVDVRIEMGDRLSRSYGDDYRYRHDMLETQTKAVVEVVGSSDMVVSWRQEDALERAVENLSALIMEQPEERRQMLWERFGMRLLEMARHG